ncbi:MAG: HU family DNA-binding protein [Clostridia bacterium]|nr:HU family DNA-binding protein [Clostridia bacterium]MBR5383889.1 HU family DNA-binding protein [Clostridia bacterium]
MNKTELIGIVAKNAGMTRKEAEKAVGAGIEAVIAAMKAGEKVQLAGFGSFEIKEHAARKARNPRTGEEIEIAASKAIAFKAGKSLKEEINK